MSETNQGASASITTGVEADAPLASERPSPDTTDGWGRWKIPLYLLVVGALVAGFVLRFWTRSPLWLDESLSVNIARLPISKIPEALRHDGHPPLYYVLLHGWMNVFGEGDRAVRALSGFWSIAAFPLLWIAARRLGGPRTALYAVVLLAVSPYAVRYGTETRMYSMVMVLSLACWLLVTDAVRRPAPARLAAIATIVGLLLWTHYWSMWLLASATVALGVRAWRAHRNQDTARLRASLAVLGAFFVGGLLFLPWVPNLLYQGAHTGTPWARPIRPTEMVTSTLADLGGGPQPEAILLGWFIGAMAFLGLTGAALGRYRIELDLRTRPRARPLALLVVGTLAIACAVGYATGATYATRYAAVFVAFVLLLAALGLDQLRSRPVAVAAVLALVVFGGVGSVRNIVADRSDGRRSADVIHQRGKPGDLIVYCPDQLGPSTDRALGDGFDQVTYPAFKRPQFVDWVDYKARLAKANPEQFARDVLARAGNRRIFYVFNTGYNTHRQSCSAIYNTLGQARPPEVITEPSGAYEPAGVALFPPVVAPAPA
ncbi:MAG: glycosyltransferase family 39 protein [Acidimicrobiales bacterium]